MLNESPSALNRVVTSLKVAAVVTVLGSVVLAAEQRLATDVSPQEVIVADMAPARADAAPAAAAAAQAAAAAAPEQQAAADYFPAHFPAPKGEPAEQVPTF